MWLALSDAVRQRRPPRLALDYTIAGRRKTRSLGTYPLTGLAQARKLVRAGRDPQQARQAWCAEAERQRERELELEALAEAGIAAQIHGLCISFDRISTRPQIGQFAVA